MGVYRYMIVKIKKIIAVLLVVFFVVSVTASTVSAGQLPDVGRHVDNAGGHPEWIMVKHIDMGQGNAGTPGYDNQQDKQTENVPGQFMGSEYRYGF